MNIQKHAFEKPLTTWNNMIIWITFIFQWFEDLDLLTIFSRLYISLEQIANEKQKFKMKRKIQI